MQYDLTNPNNIVSKNYLNFAGQNNFKITDKYFCDFNFNNISLGIAKLVSDNFLSSDNIIRTIKVDGLPNIDTPNRDRYRYGYPDSNSILLDISKDNKLLATALDCKIKIFDISEIDHIKPLLQNSYDKPFFSIKFSPDNKYLACAMGDNYDNNCRLKIFDLTNPINILVVDVHQIYCGSHSLVFSNDGSTLFFSRKENKLNIALNLALLLKKNFNI